MIKHVLKFTLILLVCIVCNIKVYASQSININADWKFIRSDVTNAYQSTFDDSAWENIALPHTWNALDGQDGGNNYFRGIGWYRKILLIPIDYNAKFAPVDATGATIVYTTDESEPDASSSIYTGPIAVSATTTIKAAAIKDGFVGKPVTISYVLTGTGNSPVENAGKIRILENIVSQTIELNMEAKRVQMVDLTGKLMLEKMHVRSINISGITPGIYLLNVVAEDDKSSTFKVIKK